MRKIACVLALVSFAALAQPSFAQIPPGPLPTPNTTPVNPQPNRTPRRVEPGRPIRLQSTLPINGFGANSLQCAANLGSATMYVGAWLAVQPNPASANRASIDIELDGRLLGAETLVPYEGEVLVRRQIQLSGANGSHRLRFLLDGAVYSEARTFTHECVRPTPLNRGAAPVAVLPNLAFGSLMYAQVAPRMFEWAPADPVLGALGERRLIYRKEGLSSSARSYTDISNLSGVIPLTAPRMSAFCAVEHVAGSERPWAEIAIEIRPSRIANPDQYLGGMNGSYAIAPGGFRVQYIDTRDGARYLTGHPADGDASEGPPLPAGHEWLVVGFPLQCTRDQQMEFSFDPNRSIAESSESDNVFRFRYSTQ